VTNVNCVYILFLQSVYFHSLKGLMITNKVNNCYSNNLIYEVTISKINKFKKKKLFGAYLYVISEQV